MLDVLIAGGGPAGSAAALVLARAGARVLVLDRAAFPRDKLCGDTLNPGALELLRALGLGELPAGLSVTGMLITGPAGARADVRYPAGVTGRTIARRDLDLILLQHAVAAGADVHERVLVTGALTASSGRVAGLTVQGRDGTPRSLYARVVIGADGRGSRLARALGLARYARWPRRWAIGGYFTDAAGVADRGEMHIRPRHYIGVAPLPGGLTNACVVTAERRGLGAPAALLTGALMADPVLADRFASARLVTRPVTLGPLAVECHSPGVPGLLLAGDAAGFVDPMTGDGLRFALRGAELAAFEALRVLEGGPGEAHRRLARRRRREFGFRLRVNRMLRRLVGSAGAVRLAAAGTRVTSWPVARIVHYAGDIRLALEPAAPATSDLRTLHHEP